MNNLGRRLESYRQVKGLKKKDLVPILGMTEQKIGTIINGKYQGSFEEFEEIVAKISDTTDDEYYYSTGKHLPAPETHTPNNTQNELLEVMKTMSNELVELKEIMSAVMLKFTREVGDLKEEIHQLKEEKKSSQVRFRQKIPETH